MISRGRSFNRNDYHIVFCTKKRYPFLTKKVYQKLRKIFKEKEDSLEFKIHIVNGMTDHIHILLSLPSKLSVSKVVNHIKGFSSHEIEELYWQKGYSSFTVDKTSFNKIFNYIKNQKTHHENSTYESEIKFFS
ncbi:MAG: IS200/IS605 family transposase [Spirochaetia bacterium]|nr:IS200/IS605 family transposase [Spirochaetia bacterium]MDH5716523.1 IS200/IS605 family transposase [Spirochaetia bacterium]